MWNLLWALDEELNKNLFIRLVEGEDVHTALDLKSKTELISFVLQIANWVRRRDTFMFNLMKGDQDHTS